jgi:hypothetical protein
MRRANAATDALQKSRHKDRHFWQNEPDFELMTRHGARSSLKTGDDRFPVTE